MSQYTVDATTYRIAPGATIPVPKYSRVLAASVHADGTVEVDLAGAADDGLGFLTRTGTAAGQAVSVRNSKDTGTQIGRADGAIAAGVDVFAGATGLVSAAGTVRLGTSISAASAANEHIQFVSDDNT